VRGAKTNEKTKKKKEEKIPSIYRSAFIWMAWNHRSEQVIWDPERPKIMTEEGVADELQYTKRRAGIPKPAGGQKKKGLSHADLAHKKHFKKYSIERPCFTEPRGWRVMPARVLDGKLTEKTGM